MCALQGRRGAGRLLSSPSEVSHKYNMRFARTMRCMSTATFSFGATPQLQCALCKDDEVQVDCCLLLWSYATNTTCASFRSARTMRCRSTVTFSLELRLKYNVRSISIRKDDGVQVDCDLLLRAASQTLKYIPSEEQSSLEGKCKHIQR